MKKIILLVTILLIFIGFKLDVYAETFSDKFYIGEVIEGISYAKVKDGKTEYRQAKFKRRASDHKIVYCLEPFVTLSEKTNYKGYDANYEAILKMSKDDWERISLLSYYGYGYDNHTEAKWYPITQILIWETIDKDAKFYWTNTYKGSKVTKYENEIKEIENLIKNHYVKPSFDGQNYDMSISSTITLEDTNKVLSKYEITNSDEVDAKIINNNLIINSNTKKENKEIKLAKRDKKYQNIPIVYVSDPYQDVLLVGSYEPVNSELSITIDSGKIKITKLDYDNNSITPSGEATLIGAIYDVLDEQGKSIGEITIGEDNTGVLENIKYGTYKIKEKTSGKGYTLDQEEYEITINKDNKVIELSLKNKVVKKRIKIHKYFGLDLDKKEVEKNITFQILDKNNNLYKEVTTNEYGEIELELPYGTYTVKQINTTSGYEKVEDFTINVNEDSDEVIEFYLNDLKIPDTLEYNYTSIIIFSLLSLVSLLCFKVYYEK